jgi:hypothetical protein
MARTPACTRALAAAAAACLAALACRENISAPGQCPALCPSSQVQVSNDTLFGVDTSDVAVRGFVTPAEGTILVASDLDSLKGRVLLRFVTRPTRWFPVASDTAGVTIGGVDSATLDLRIARDTAVKNLRMLLYRLPASVDSNATFTSMTAYFADSMLIDSIRVDSIPGNDTLRFIALHHRFLPAALVEPFSSDSGVVAMGVGFRADARTAVTVSAVESGASSARLKFYVHGVAPQDTLRHTFELGPSFDTFVTNPVPAAPDTGLLVGNIPSARSIVRFRIPRSLIDSTTVVRATLVMSQLRSATGRPGETFTVEARPVIRDYAGKSLTHTDTTVYGRATVTVGDTAQLAFEVAPMLRFWRVGGDSLPRTMLLRVRPEGGVLGEVTLAGRTAGARAPFLVVTYVRPYAFGVP